MVNIWVYAGLFIAGVAFGVTMVYKRYANRQMDMLEFLKASNQINDTTFEYCKSKFIDKTDSLKGVKSVIKFTKKRKEVKTE